MFTDNPNCSLGKKKSSSFLPDSWLNLELPFASAKLFCSWLACRAPSGVLRARWHNSEPAHSIPRLDCSPKKNLEWQGYPEFKYFVWFLFCFSFLAASVRTVLEANTNTASVTVSAEGTESFSSSKSQAFLGMPFPKKHTYLLNLGHAWGSLFNTEPSSCQVNIRFCYSSAFIFSFSCVQPSTEDLPNFQNCGADRQQWHCWAWWYVRIKAAFPDKHSKP